MFDLNKLADSKNRYAVMALNLVAGVALLSAAAWFSYNLFSTRDLTHEIRQRLRPPDNAVVVAPGGNDPQAPIIIVVPEH